MRERPAGFLDYPGAGSAGRLAGKTLALLRIRRGEGRRVALMIVYSAAAMGGVHTVGKSVASALFLSRLPESAIPYMFILPGAATVPALLLYSAAAGRLRAKRVVVTSALGLLALVLLLRVLLTTSIAGSFGLLAVLFLVVDLATTLVLLQFWTYAGEVFDAREARRLFGLIAVGGTISNIVAGLTLHQLASLIGADNLLFPVAASLAVCAACAWALGRLPEVDEQVQSREVGLRAGLDTVRRSPLLVSVGWLTLLVAVLVSLGTYQFFLEVHRSYTGRDESMVAFLGAFQIWAGLAALVVQLDLTGRIMGRLGAFAALLVFPLSMAIGSVASLATQGSLASVTLLRGSDPVFRHTINQAGTNVLYLPIRADLARRAKELHGVVFAIGLGTIGLFFLALRWVPEWSSTEWAILVFAIVGVWIALLLRTRGQYRQALAESVGRRRLDIEVQPVDLLEESTAAILADALQHEDELHALHALQLISTQPSPRWNERLLPLLESDSLELRLAALDLLAQTGSAPERDAIAPLLRDPDPRLRAAAIEAICEIGGDELNQVLASLADSAEASIRSAASVGLIRHGGPNAVSAEAELLSMLESDDAAERAAAASAIGELGSSTLSTALSTLLGDPEVTVRRAAVEAAQTVAIPELVPGLIRNLGDKSVGSTAIDALAAIGAGALTEVDDLLSAGDALPGTRTNAAKVLGRIGTAAAAELLKTHIHEPDQRVRSAVQGALARIRRAEATAIDELPLKEMILVELREYYETAAIRADLGSAAGELIDDALRERMGRSLDRVFFILTILHPEKQLPRARRAIDSDRPRSRAMAIELVVSLAERPFGDLLVAAVEATEPAALQLAVQRIGVIRRTPRERLSALAEDEDPWLAACAIRQIGELGWTNLADAVSRALVQPDELIRETAARAAPLLAIGSA